MSQIQPTIAFQRSRMHYTTKPTPNSYRTMTWVDVSSTPIELFEYLKNGFTIRCMLSSLANTQTRSFVGSNIIAFDYDHSIYDMATTIDIIPIKPTFGYVSFSRYDDDGNHRFRLVYVFDTPFTDEIEWGVVAHDIGNIIEFGDDDKSYCATSNWNGTNNDGVWIGNIYKKPIVEKSRLESVSAPSVDTYTKDERNTLTDPLKCEIEASIYDAYRQASDLYDVYAQFKDRYTLYEESLPIKEHATHYEYDKGSYVRLLRKHCVSESGRPYVGKWSRRDHRHNYIYADVKILMQIKPDITIDEVLFNICHEIGMFYDYNGRIPKEDIIENIIKAYTDNKPFDYRGKRRGVRMKNGYKYSKVMSDLKKQACLELYDCNLTITQNVILLKDNDIDVTRQTLAKYIKEEALTLKQPHFIASYKPKQHK